jgi:hypothetical protein
LPRQQIGDPPRRTVGQPRQHIGEPGLRIDVVELAWPNALGRPKTVGLAFNGEQGIDRLTASAAIGALFDARQIEELVPRMGPSRRPL